MKKISMTDSITRSRYRPFWARSLWVMLAASMTLPLTASAQDPTIGSNAAPPAAAMPQGPSLSLLGMPPKVDVLPVQTTGARELEAGAVSPAGYTILRRVHAANWMTALFLMPYSTEEAAKQALLDTAAREGGDGVMNMQCLR